jgi:hypothetical protein
MRRWINRLLEYDASGKLVRVEGYWHRGPIARAGAVATRGEDWAFYNDDGSESGATIIGAQNTNPTKGGIPNDAPFAFRFGVQETSGGAWNNAAPSLQFNHNGAGLVDVTTTSSPIKAIALAGPGAPADGSSTTQRITGATIAVFKTVNDGVSFDGVAGGVNADFDADTNDGAEMLYGLQIDGAAVADNDTIVLHVQKQSGTDLNAYAQTDPTITVEVAAAGATVDVPLKALTRAGQVPAVASGASVAAPLQAFTSTGFAPAVAAGAAVASPLKSYTRSGFSPAVAAGADILAPLMEFTRTGFAPGVTAGSAGPDILVPVKAFTRSGQVPAVAAGASVTSPAKAFTRAGFAPAVASGVGIPVPLQAFSLGGLVPGVASGSVVIVPLKAFGLTGLAPGVGSSVLVLVPAKAFTSTGFAPAVASGAGVVIPTGSFTRTGLAPAIQAGDSEEPEYKLPALRRYFARLFT